VASGEAAALAAKRPRLELRSRVIQTVRTFFVQEGFLEVQTPVLSPEPAPEPHIEPVAAGSHGFLMTSPELYMKRMMAAGYQRIFQLAPVFRSGERGRLHHPEFTMLEWYRLEADYETVQRDCRGLVRAVCRNADRWPAWRFGDHWLAADGEWEDLSVVEAFRRHAGWEPRPDVNQASFDMDLVSKVEPHLGFSSPCILRDYPANQAALARLKPDNPGVAERFEVYWAGIELANGFSELTDAEEQRLRFTTTLRQREERRQTPVPMPEAFLTSLQELPPCAGVAFGIDRLVLLLAGAGELDEVVAFPPGT